jgi:hypothetical protein
MKIAQTFGAAGQGLLGAVAVAGLVCGCAVRQHNLGDSQTLESQADTRVVVARPGTFTTGQKGSFRPRQVVCAEPSPDVAKIVSKSFGMSGALEAIVQQPEAKVDAAGKAAAAISKSEAEALAQLTSRLATIQLLRDGLYRACEAYANGALSPITYSVILSGYGDVMVTLLTGELVAGNFGQPLAVLGTQASGAAGAATKAKEDAGQANARVEKAQNEFTQAQNGQIQAKQNLQTCLDREGGDRAKCRSEDEALTTANGKLGNAQSGLTAALVQAMGDVSAAVSGQASATIAEGVGSVASQDDRGYRAYLLTDLQQRFLANVNKDSIAIACLSALAEPPDPGQPDPPLVRLCEGMFSTMVAGQGQQIMFQMRKDRPTGALIESCSFAVQKAKDPAYQGDLSKVLEDCNTSLSEAMKQEWARELQRATPPGGSIATGAQAGSNAKSTGKPCPSGKPPDAQGQCPP